MKFVERMVKGIKSFAKRGKVLICTAAAAVSTAAIAVCASAETAEATNDMETMMKSAGDQLNEQFSTLVSTIIPVVLGILGSGIVIFGIIALIKLAKKTFTKVAG